MAHSAPAPEHSDIATINELVDALDAGRRRLGAAEPGAREGLIATARELIANLETPFEAMQWIAVAEPTRTAASRIALDLRLYESVSAEEGRPKSVDELAQPTGAAPALVLRIARKLASMGMMAETAPGHFAPTRLTRILAEPRYGEGLRFCFDGGLLSFQKMPEYLVTRHFANPEDAADGPFKFAHGTDDVWAWLSARPDVLKAFFAYLQSQREDHPYWTDAGFYPVRERLVNGLKDTADAVAVVDVGGGNGYALEDLRVRVPELHGRLVLQELPHVIDHVRSTSPHGRIELMEHDFNTEQTVKGARAYFLRHVLHDYNDAVARSILDRLKLAMEPGYSKILLNEIVLADRGAAWQHTSLDMFLLAMNTSQERSEAEWRRLIASAGLEVAGIWTQGIGSESLIEVVLPAAAAPSAAA